MPSFARVHYIYVQVMPRFLFTYLAAKVIIIFVFLYLSRNEYHFSTGRCYTPSLRSF